MHRQDQEALYQHWLHSDEECPPDELLELCDEDEAEIASDPEVVETLSDAFTSLIRSRLPQR